MNLTLSVEEKERKESRNEINFITLERGGTKSSKEGKKISKGERNRLQHLDRRKEERRGEIYRKNIMLHMKESVEHAGTLYR